MLIDIILSKQIAYDPVFEMIGLILGAHPQALFSSCSKKTYRQHIEKVRRQTTQEEQSDAVSTDSEDSQEPNIGTT